jgi:hypothetical protein
LYRDQRQVAKAKEMFERAAEGYEDAEGDHEAVNTHLRKQLSILMATDDEDRDSQPMRQQPIVAAAVIPVRGSVAPGEVANTLEKDKEVRIKHKKRDFVLRILKR